VVDDDDDDDVSDDLSFYYMHEFIDFVLCVFFSNRRLEHGIMTNIGYLLSLFSD
jgi:hypothetical protein